MANRRKSVILVSFLLVVLVTQVIHPHSSYANILEDAVDVVKQLINPQNSEVVLDHSITLKENAFGDSDVIDAGDTITFTFILTNTTDQEYSLAILDTGIPRDSLHFIHNIIGTTGLTDTDNSIQLTNVVLLPNQKLTITFDARLNYFFDQDFELVYSPKFKTKEGEIVVETSETKQSQSYPRRI